MKLIEKYINDPSGLLVGIGIIVVFLVLPYLLLIRRKRNLTDFGLQGFSLKTSILIGCAVSLTILPLFALVYIAGAKYIPDLPLVDWNSVVKRIGLSGILRAVGRTALIHIVFVGITEEVFYRCYMQSNLNLIFGKRWKLFRVEIGPGLFITAVLFGLVHMFRWGPGGINPLGILAAIPGLGFGFLREWSGGFAAPAIFHGMCNTVIFMLNGYMFFSV